MRPMAIFIPVEEAKSRFDEILERVEHGEEVVLERDGRSVVTMAPSPAAPEGAVELGWAKGQIEQRERRFRDGARNDHIAAGLE